jgi:hypothetical protein
MSELPRSGENDVMKKCRLKTDPDRSPAPDARCGKAYLEGTEHQRGLFDVKTPEEPKRFPPKGRIRFRADSRRLFC